MPAASTRICRRPSCLEQALKKAKHSLTSFAGGFGFPILLHASQSAYSILCRPPSSSGKSTSLKISRSWNPSDLFDCRWTDLGIAMDAMDAMNAAEGRERAELTTEPGPFPFNNPFTCHFRKTCCDRQVREIGANGMVGMRCIGCMMHVKTRKQAFL